MKNNDLLVTKMTTEQIKLEEIDESLEEKNSLEEDMDSVLDESPYVSEAKMAIDEINYGVSELIDMRI